MDCSKRIIPSILNCARVTWRHSFFHYRFCRRQCFADAVTQIIPDVVSSHPKIAISNSVMNPYAKRPVQAAVRLNPSAIIAPGQTR